jgi:hypothetical protein
MRPSLPAGRLLLIALALAIPAVGEATVFFQNTGTKSGWHHVGPPQQQGRILQVTSPTWNGGTALAMEQTFTGALTGYHSEVVQDHVQRNGQDRYYGQVIRLPANWVFHPKNDTFQQFSPEDPSGPWILNWIEGDRLKIRFNGTHYDLGTISRSTWVRVIVRLKLGNPGAAEVWINGTRKVSLLNIDHTIKNGSPTIRWSVGIYCTSWRTTPPPPGDATVRTIYHDQLRIASSPGEADPIHW